VATDEERAAAIAALFDSLTTLGGRGPGPPLRADDWNSLVGAVTKAVRLATAEPVAPPGPVPGAPGELPPGSVGMEELAVEVQNVLRTGPFADTAQQGTRFTLERRLSAVTERLAAVESRLDSLLTALHRTDTDLSRQGSDLRLVDQRVAGTTGLKAEVGDLRTLLGSVRTDMTDVLVLRRQLDGVNFGELRANVDELTRFRDAWRDEQGEVLTFGGFTRRLSDVADRGVSDAELGPILDSRFEHFVVDPGPIRTAVTNDLRAEVLASKEQIARESADTVAQTLAELRAALDADVTRAVGGQVEVLTGRLSDIAATAAAERLAAARDQIRADTIQLVEDRVGRLGPHVTPGDLATVTDRLNGLDARIGAAATAKDEINVLLAQVRTDLGRQIDGVAASADGNRRSQAELGATLRRERADAAAAESRRLEGLITAQAARAATERSGAIDAAVQGVTSDLGARIDRTAQTLRAERDTAVATAVDLRTAAIRSELEARIRVVATDAVAAVESDVLDLRGQLRGFGGQINDLSKRIGTGLQRQQPGPLILPVDRPPGGGG
jgi:hypothetical protein